MPDHGYGYVPADESEISLIELFQVFWDKRLLILKITGTFIFLGLLIAVLSPKEYSTSATLMPEAQSTQSRAGSLLQQYGGFLGINGGLSMGQEGSIPPQLFPNIVQGLPFQIELMNTPVQFTEYDTTVTPHVFFTKIYSPTFFSYLLDYTVGLPGKLIGLLKEEIPQKPLITKANRDSILSLSREQMETVETLRERLSVNINQETGLLTLTVEFPDPQAAAEIGKAGIFLLKEHVKQYRTEKARQNLEFAREQVREARERFEEAQNQLAEFRDSNLNLATAKAQTREQELQSEYDLAFNLYNSLSQRLEQAKLELQEETPVLTILQPVSVPLEDNTSGILILIVSGMLGAIISLGWVLVSNWWKYEKHRFNS